MFQYSGQYQPQPQSDFSITPGNNMLPGLQARSSGLETIQVPREKKQAMERAEAKYAKIRTVMEGIGQIQDPYEQATAIADAAAENGEISEAVKMIGGLYTDAQGKNPTLPIVENAYLGAWTDPENAAHHFESAIQRVQEMGGNPENLIRDYEAFRKNPEAGRASAAGVLAGLNPDKYKAVSEIYGPTGDRMGKVDPRWYTPRSMSKFQKSGDYGDLEYRNYVSPQDRDIAAARLESLQSKKALDESTLAARGRTEAADEVRLKQVAIQNQARAAESAEAAEHINYLMGPEKDADLQIDRLDKIYGRFEGQYPTIARSQEGHDMRARINQIVGLVSLAASSKVKGQGTLTDGERKMLAESATLLGNYSISPEIAHKELMRIQQIFRTAADRGKPTGGERREAPPAALQMLEESKGDPSAIKEFVEMFGYRPNGY